jgi:hypothetical protein
MKYKNILSYFKKNLEDSNISSLYKQYQDDKVLRIYYKDKLIYKIYLNAGIFEDYINNLMKQPNINKISNYKISKFRTNKKTLFFKQDNKINKINWNAIFFWTTRYPFYFNKMYFQYYLDGTQEATFKIIYYKNYKYKYKLLTPSKLKTYPIILIQDKYEMQYINRFLNIFFDRYYLACINVYN